VVVVPNFNVSNGQRIYPAVDLSEQISTAGKEASGTGNMKFSMNGALTIGTLDGANIELRDAVGADNFFLFGLTVREVVALRERGYSPHDLYLADPRLRAVIDSLRTGVFSPSEPDLFAPLVDSLLQHDPYFAMADFAAYADCQQQVDAVYREPEKWTRMAILNTARSGTFSSDRTIMEYARDIWKIEPLPIRLLTPAEIKAGFLR
jgi:starch phosphorylase